jgi:hypothetical protein
MRSLVFAMTAGLLLPAAARAGDACSAAAACDPAACAAPGDCDPGCCEHCGARKVCKVVCEMKKVRKTVWAVECEEFCPLLPRLCRDGDPCCDPCQPACRDRKCGKCRDCCDPCAEIEGRKYVPPKCGKLRTVKKLVRKEIECEVPGYKCVVVCPRCNGDPAGWGPSCGEEAAAAGGQTTLSAPLPPVIGASYAR